MPEINVSPIDEDAILKEVWNLEQIEAKTELTDFQIATINKLSTMADLFGSELLNKHINQFLILQKSRRRKSMEEFINAVKAKREDFVNKGKSWMQTMMG
jgi:hypothetical protein